MRCENCQPLILDYLYGLLDGPEADAVETHLRDCAGCAAARDDAARVQGLIARAAKQAFPRVRFDPTAKLPRSPVLSAPKLAADAASPAAPALASGPARRQPRALLGLSWAIAAAVLLAVPGTVIPVWGLLKRAETTRAEAAASFARATEATRATQTLQNQITQQREAAAQALNEARQAHDAVLTRWVAEERAILQALTDRNKMLVEVRKPAAIQPGAPNEFLVSIRGDRSTAPNARLYAEIRDQTDAVIYSQRLDMERRGDTPIRLPAQAWTNLKPQSELFLVITSEDQKTGARTPVQDRIRLFGPVYATMLATDKSTYRPGETVYFRSLTLDRVTFKPPEREQLLHFELVCNTQTPMRNLSLTGSTDLVRVVNGQVEPVRGPDNKPIRGVGTGAFLLPSDLDEGDYTLVLHELPHPAGYPPAVPFPVVRPIKVQSGPTDVYQKVVRFAGAGYRPGEMVEGWAELRFEDQPVAGATVQLVGIADGSPLEVAVLQPATGSDGRVRFRFTLPRELERGDVRLKATFHARYGEGIREESVAERVPVVGRSLIVEFFPEGGTLVAGVPCRVYFRATTPSGLPVDLRGVITDGRTELARVETIQDAAEAAANRGIGSFTYTPTLGTPVWLKLDNDIYTPLLQAAFPIAPAAVAGAPVVASVRTRFALPLPQIEGVVMTVPDTVTAPGEPIRVHLRSVGKERNLVVGAYIRGRLADTQKVTARPGELAAVQLLANSDSRGGVVRITVFEEQPEESGQPVPDLHPLAERLVFRRPGELLNLNLSLSGRPGLPRTPAFPANTPVELTITATDEKGQATAAILWATAVNSGVAPGPKDRLLTTHFLLAGEISSPDAMEYADFLLTDHPLAAQVLDGVLATQGWRRFAEQTPAPLTRRTVLAPPEHAALQANSGQYGTWNEGLGVREHRRLYEVYQPRYEVAKKALEAAEARHAAALADATAEQQLRELVTRAEQIHQEAVTAADKAAAANRPLQRFQQAGWYGVAGFGLLAVMLAIASYVRPVARLPLGIGTAGSVGLVAFLVFALVQVHSAQAGDPNGWQPTAQPVPPSTPSQPPVEAPAAKSFAGTAPLAPAPRSSSQDETNTEQPRLSVSAPPSSAAGGGANTAVAGSSGFAASPLGTPEVHSGGVPGTPSGRPKDSGFQKSDRDIGTPPMSGLPVGSPPLGSVTGGGSGFGNMVGKAQPGGLGGPLFKESRPKGGPFPALPQLPMPPFSSQPLTQLDGGSGWQPGDKFRAIPDSELKDRMRNATRKTPGTHQSTDTASIAQAANSPSISESFQSDLQRVHEQTQHQNRVAIEQLYRAYAQKQAIPVEQLKEQVNALMTGRGTVNLPKQGFVPPRPPGGLGRGMEAELIPGLPPLPELQALLRVQLAMVEPTPLVVREYAPPRPGSTDPAGPVHQLPDTILWQPVIVLSSTGKTTLPLMLGSAEGGYQVIVAGHTLDGRLGAVRTIIPIAPSGPTSGVDSSRPVPPKMP